MKGDPLPDGHHVVRYVGGTKIDDGIGHPDGFRGQKSVNWLECVDGNEGEQLDRVRSLLRLRPGATAKLAVLEFEDCKMGSLLRKTRCQLKMNGQKHHAMRIFRAFQKANWMMASNSAFMKLLRTVCLPFTRPGKSWSNSTIIHPFRGAQIQGNSYRYSCVVNKVAP